MKKIFEKILKRDPTKLHWRFQEKRLEYSFIDFMVDLLIGNPQKAKDLDIEELNLNKSEYRSALKNIILEFQTVDWDKADHHEEFQKIKSKFKSSSENQKLLAAELIEWGLGNRYYSDGAKKDKS